MRSPVSLPPPEGLGMAWPPVPGAQWAQHPYSYLCFHLKNIEYLCLQVRGGDKETQGPLCLPCRSRHTGRVEMKLAVGKRAQSSPPSSARTGCGRQARLEVRLPGLQRPARRWSKRCRFLGTVTCPAVYLQEFRATQELGMVGCVITRKGAHILIPGACECYFTGQRGLGQRD